MESILKNESLPLKNKGWYKKKLFVYNFLDKPSTKLSYVYHVIVLLIIVSNTTLGIISTVDLLEYNTKVRLALLVYEFVLLIFFLLEYFIRLLVCSANVKYRGVRGRLVYIKTFYMVVDTLVIITSVITVSVHINATYITVVRYARLFQILRFIRMDRSRGDLHTMWQAIYSHRKELLICYFFCAVVLLLGSHVIFIMERNIVSSEGRIDNMLNGLYWGIITFTTIGFGDYTPHTWYGKLITGLLSLVGCAFFALPAGILGSGFALQVSKQKKEKGSIKVRNPAAFLIQCAWRSYAVRNSNLKATWRYFLNQKVAAKAKAKAAKPKYIKVDITAISDFNAVIPNKVIDDVTVSDSLITKPKPNSSNKQFDNKMIGLKKVKKKPEQVDNFVELLDIFQKIYDDNNWLTDKIHIKYKLVYKFLTILKLILASRSFSDTRYPYVNIEHILQASNLSLSCSLSHLKDTKKSLAIIFSEINELKQEIRDLKNKNLETIIDNEKNNL